MKLFLAATFVMFSTMSKAEVSQADVTKMLDQMVEQKVISPEEAEKVRIKMKGMNGEQWSQINQVAKGAASRSPASVEPSQNEIQEVNKIDLDSAQFKQIQDDLKKFVPQQHD